MVWLFVDVSCGRTTSIMILDHLQNVITIFDFLSLIFFSICFSFMIFVRLFSNCLWICAYKIAAWLFKLKTAEGYNFIASFLVLAFEFSSDNWFLCWVCHSWGDFSNKKPFVTWQKAVLIDANVAGLKKYCWVWNIAFSFFKIYILRCLVDARIKLSRDWMDRSGWVGLCTLQNFGFIWMGSVTKYAASFLYRFIYTHDFDLTHLLVQLHIVVPPLGTVLICFCYWPHLLW